MIRSIFEMLLPVGGVSLCSAPADGADERATKRRGGRRASPRRPPSTASSTSGVAAPRHRSAISCRPSLGRSARDRADRRAAAVRRPGHLHRRHLLRQRPVQIVTTDSRRDSALSGQDSFQMIWTPTTIARAGSSSARTPSASSTTRRCATKARPVGRPARRLGRTPADRAAA